MHENCIKTLHKVARNWQHWPICWRRWIWSLCISPTVLEMHYFGKAWHLGTFQKGKNRSTRHLSSVGMFFPFLLVAGPQHHAVVLQGSARFAQGFDSSARQVPETREQMILANQGQNRAQTSRKLIRKLRLPEPPRAHAPPHFWLTLLYSELPFSEQLLFFPFLYFPQTVQPHVPPAEKVHRASDIYWLWHVRRFAYHFFWMRHMHQEWIE